MQIVGDNLHELSKLVFWKKKTTTKKQKPHQFVKGWILEPVHHVRDCVDSECCTGWSESIILHMSRGYFLFEESHTQTDQCFCQWGQLLHLLDFLPFFFLWETTFVTSFFLSCTPIPSWKGVFSERKEFANSFFLEKTPFQKGDSVILTELPPLKVFPLIWTAKTQ